MSNHLKKGILWRHRAPQLILEISLFFIDLDLQEGQWAVRLLRHDSLVAMWVTDTSSRPLWMALDPTERCQFGVPCHLHIDASPQHSLQSELVSFESQKSTVIHDCLLISAHLVDIYDFLLRNSFARHVAPVTFIAVFGANAVFTDSLVQDPSSGGSRGRLGGPDPGAVTFHAPVGSVKRRLMSGYPTKVTWHGGMKEQQPKRTTSCLSIGKDTRIRLWAFKERRKCSLLPPLKYQSNQL
jgi:hypothetical protein